MPVISISVQNKTAVQTDNTIYVCGNSDYSIQFSFDSEWDEFPVKTARFQADSGFTDILFRGDSCPVPALDSIRKLEVGVYAGNLQTTTPAKIFVKSGIRSVWGSPDDPQASVYDQIMDAFRDTGLTLRQLEDGVELTVHYLGGVSTAIVRHSEVYVGPGDMPEGYVVQIDPTVDTAILKIRNSDGTALVIPAIQGEKGEKGDKGDPGPQGPQGDVGEDVVKNINGIGPDEEGNLTLLPEDIQAVSRLGDTMEGPLNLNGNRITSLATPEDNSDAASKAYVDGKRTTWTATITTTWSGSGPYTQSVTVSGILASDMPHIMPVYSTTNATAINQKTAWACVSKAVTAANTITFTCFEEKPTTAIPIQIEVMR